MKRIRGHFDVLAWSVAILVLVAVHGGVLAIPGLPRVATAMSLAFFVRALFVFFSVCRALAAPPDDFGLILLQEIWRTYGWNGIGAIYGNLLMALGLSIYAHFSQVN